MGLITLYLRKEPTQDSTTLALWPNTKRQDVVAYSDEACTQKVARWPWFYSNNPTKRNKTVMLNCWRWAVQWLPSPSEVSQ